MTKYLSFPFRSIFAPLMLILAVPQSGYAQENQPAPFSIQTDSVIYSENGAVVALTLVLANNTNADFSGTLDLKSVQGLQMIGKDNISIAIDAGKKSFYPVRLSVGKEVPAGESPVALLLTEASGMVRAQFTSKLVITAKKQVRLIAYRQNELMRQVGDSLDISVLLSNQGNSDELISLSASFPDLRGGKDMVERKVTIRAFQDSIIHFKRIISRELIKVEHYSVNVAALYSNGELINNLMITVQNVSGNRSYSDPTQQGFSGFGSNRIRVSGSNLFSPNESIQINGNGIFQLPAGSLAFGLNALDYTQTNSRPLVTNTFLTYELNNKGITIGNISESMETFVNGRGVKVFTHNEEETQRVELAYIDKTYNLLGDEYYSGAETGYTAYARTQFGNSAGRMYSGSVLYDRAPTENTESAIIMNHYQFQTERFRAGFDVGGGITREFHQPVEGYKPSLAVGNSLQGQIGSYTISSENFYSSGYYPGIRRGVLQLNERISRNFRQMQAWLGFNYYAYRPEFIDNPYLVNSDFSNSRIEGGLSFPVGLRLNMNVSLNRQEESGRTGLLGGLNTPDMRLVSYRAVETLGWRSANNQHMVYISAENGFFKSPATGKNELLLRTNASWNYKFFNLNTYYQRGAFTLTEAFGNAGRQSESAYRFNISPGFRHDFLNRRLKVQVNANYNQDSFSGKNLMYSGNFDFEISPRLSTFINGYFYNFSGESYSASNATVQAGLSYNLPDGRNVTSGQRGNISVFVFYDNNANGQFDSGDQAAPERIVTIGGITFVSGRDGTVQYRKVPHGEYSLTIPSQEWYAHAPDKIEVRSRDTQLAIPLQRTGKISGSFFYRYDPRTSMEIYEKYGGLQVEVVGDNGFSARALTNSNGEFTLFVPVGTYTFSVSANFLPKDVFTKMEPMKVTVSESETVAIPKVELNVKQRVVEVKRFSSE
jgi:hypothetical protein